MLTLQAQTNGVQHTRSAQLLDVCQDLSQHYTIFQYTFPWPAGVLLSDAGTSSHAKTDSRANPQAYPQPAHRCRRPMQNPGQDTFDSETSETWVE